MSKYYTIDEIVRRWVDDNGLHLFTSCKGEETRVVRLTDAQGRTYGIGIDPPNSGQVTVRYYAWDFRKRNKTETVSIERVGDALEDALAQVRKWMGA